MKAARRHIISELIQSQPFISLRELEKQFPDVTGMTLRRDIEFFEKRGELIKVRGGARSMKFIAQSPADDEMQNTLKLSLASIAARAVAFAPKSGVCFIDSEAVCVHFAKEFPDEYLSVITASCRVATELCEKRQPEITLLGGDFSKESLSVSGACALEMLKDMEIDIAFMSAEGYSHMNGFNCKSAPESEIKALVIKKAKRVIMLMDSSRIDRTYPFPFCKLSDIDILITDKKVPASFLHTSSFPNLKHITCSEKESGMRGFITKCLTDRELESLREKGENK